METKIIPTGRNVEQNRQSEIQTPIPGLEKDVDVVRNQLMTIIKGGKSNNQVNLNDGKAIESALHILYTDKPPIRKVFTKAVAEQTFDVFETTNGVEETAVGIYANEVADDRVTFGKVIELNSAKRGATSVQYNPEELLENKDGMVSVGSMHNHLIGKDVTKMKNGEETSVQEKSTTDVKSDKDLSSEVDKVGDIEANHYTSALAMPYDIDGETYRTVAITGLTSGEYEWQPFEYEGQMTHQLVKTPNGEIKRLEELSEYIKAHIVQHRLMAA